MLHNSVLSYPKPSLLCDSSCNVPLVASLLGVWTCNKTSPISSIRTHGTTKRLRARSLTYNRSGLLAPIMFDLMLALSSMMTNCWRIWEWMRMVSTASEQQHRLKYCSSRNIVLFNTGKNLVEVFVYELKSWSALQLVPKRVSMTGYRQTSWKYTLIIDAILDNAIVRPAGSPDLLYVNGRNRGKSQRSFYRIIIRSLSDLLNRDDEHHGKLGVHSNARVNALT